MIGIVRHFMHIRPCAAHFSVVLAECGHFVVTWSAGITVQFDIPKML